MVPMATQSVFNTPGAGRARSTTTVLTNAEVLALATVPIDVVPSLGPNKMAFLTSVNLVGHFEAAAYGGIDDEALLYVGTANSAYRTSFLANTASTFLTDVDTFFGVTDGPGVYLANILPLLNFDPAALTIGTASSAYTAATAAGHPLQLTLQNVPGPMTGGDPANTLTVYCTYQVVSF